MSLEIYHYVAAYAVMSVAAWGFLVAAAHNSDIDAGPTEAVLLGWVLALIWPVFVFALIFHRVYFRGGKDE